MAFFDLLGEPAVPVQAQSACRTRPIAGAEAQVARHLGWIILNLDLGIEHRLGVEQLLGPHEQIINGGILALDIGAAQPAVAVLARDGAAQAVHQFVYRVGDGLQQIDISWIFEVEQRPGVHQSFGDMAIEHEMDPEPFKKGINPLEIGHQSVHRHGGVLHQGQDLAPALELVQRGHGCFAHSPESGFFARRYRQVRLPRPAG